MSHNLTDMKLPKRKNSDNEVAIASDAGDRFPHGLSISLDNDSMKKLGFDGLPAVGTEMIVVGIGRITNASENRRQNGVDRHMSIQLEMVEVEPFTKEDNTAVSAVTKALKEV